MVGKYELQLHRHSLVRHHLPGVRQALATALFKYGQLSLTRSARLAGMPLAGFISHVPRLGISVIKQTAEEVQQNMDTLEQWLEQR